MIPRNLKRNHILRAIFIIEKQGIPKSRKSTKFQLLHNGKFYPPKYVISLANKFANGKELPSESFSGGDESNRFLQSMDFQIIGSDISRTMTSKRILVTRNHHDERCSECKNVIIEMLRKAYGTIKIDHKIMIPARLEDYRGKSCHLPLQKIFSALINYRGHKNFIRLKTLHRCDLYITNPGFVVELDESQHFTKARYLTLENYPPSLSLGFSRNKWANLCTTLHKKDNDPVFRDEQRAWYDTLRDFLPVINGFAPTLRIHMGEMQWCKLNPNDANDFQLFMSKFHTKSINSNKPLKSDKKQITIATITIQSNGEYTNGNRTQLLEKIITELPKQVDILLLPAGFYDTPKPADDFYPDAKKYIKRIVTSHSHNLIVCLGVDGREGKDQMALAINSSGKIIALGRKFHPTPQEKEEGTIQLASSALATKKNYSRIFQIKGKKFYLAVCYDGFGIRHKNIMNPGVDIILDLVHGFYPKGEGLSGDPYFAKHGFAGSAKQWKCPTFGAAVFFKRPIPENWPTGVIWNQGNKSTQNWKYKYNPLLPTTKPLNIKNGSELARVCIFVL